TGVWEAKDQSSEFVACIHVEQQESSKISVCDWAEVSCGNPTTVECEGTSNSSGVRIYLNTSDTNVNYMELSPVDADTFQGRWFRDSNHTPEVIVKRQKCCGGMH